MKNFINQKSLKAIMIEMASIITAVLVALAVNDWDQERNNQKNVRQALAKISSEIEQNIKILENTHENNQQILERLGKDRQEGQFRPALHIQHTAWQTALSTGTTEHIKYEQLYGLSKVYAIQEMYKKFTYDLVQTMMRTNAMAIALDDDIKNDDDVPGQSFDQYFTLVVSVEKSLLEGLRIAHKKLKDSGY